MVTPPDYATEFHTIERTVEIVVGLEVFRIEVLQSNDKQKAFSTRVYERDHIVAQPAYPLSHGSFERKPDTFEIWKSIDVGWTLRDTADGALSQAMGFLGERFRKN